MRKWLTGFFTALLVLAGFASVLSLEPPGVFAFSDKMVYGRPAEVTIYGIVLDVDGNPVPNVVVSIDVISPENDIVFSVEVSTGGDGKFSRSFRLPASASEGTYQVIVSDLEGEYEPAVFYFEVCPTCGFPAYGPTTTVSTVITSATTILRTSLVTTTFTRNVTRLDTVYVTVGGGQVKTVFSTVYSVVNGSVVSVTVTAEVFSGASYVFYVGLGMVAVLAVAAFFAVRRFSPAG